MKKQIILLAALMVQAAAMTAATADTLTVRIKGMRCDECANKVMKTLNSLPGIQDIQFNLERRTATVAFDAATTSADSIRARLAATKRYAPTAYSKTDVIRRGMGFHIDDMHCQKCYNRIEARLHPMEGIDSMAPHLDKQYVFIRYDANRTDKATIRQAICDLGFTPVNHYTSSTVDFGYFLIDEQAAQDAETYEKALIIKGVEDVCVNPRRKALAITYFTDETSEDQLIKELKDAGITATLPPLHVCNEEQK